MIFVNVEKTVFSIFYGNFRSFTACFVVYRPVDVLAYAVI